MQDLVQEQPLVSVVIATYNMGQYLKQAVDSVLGQTWGNIELIVVDDGSSDNTPEVMAAYTSNDKVRYIQNENQGQPKAKNCGIRAAKGEYLGFCDADDVWEPNKLELQLPQFGNPQVGVVYTEVSYMDEHGKRYQQPQPYIRHEGKVTDQLLQKNFVPFGTAVIRKQCVEKSGIFDERFRMGIDWHLWLRYSLDWEFAYVPESTYVYREWSGQMSKNMRGRYEFANKILASFVEEHGDSLNKAVVRKAWADMYFGQANAFARTEKRVFEPLGYTLKGLALDPLCLSGWKTLVKVVIRWY